MQRLGAPRLRHYNLALRPQNWMWWLWCTMQRDKAFDLKPYVTLLSVSWHILALGMSWPITTMSQDCIPIERWKMGWPVCCHGLHETLNFFKVKWTTSWMPWLAEVDVGVQPKSQLCWFFTMFFEVEQKVQTCWFSMFNLQTWWKPLKSVESCCLCGENGASASEQRSTFPWRVCSVNPGARCCRLLWGCFGLWVVVLHLSIPFHTSWFQCYPAFLVPSGAVGLQVREESDAKLSTSVGAHVKKTQTVYQCSIFLVVFLCMCVGRYIYIWMDGWIDR